MSTISLATIEKINKLLRQRDDLENRIKIFHVKKDLILCSKRQLSHYNHYSQEYEAIMSVSNEVMCRIREDIQDKLKETEKELEALGVQI